MAFFGNKIVALLVLAFFSTKVFGQVAIIEASDETTTVTICGYYNPYNHDLKPYRDSLRNCPIELLDLYKTHPTDICNLPNENFNLSVSGKAVAVDAHVCWYRRQVAILSYSGARVAFLVSPNPIFIPNRTLYSSGAIGIVVANDSFSQLQNLEQPSFVRIYKPSVFNPGWIILFLIALGSLLLGTFLTGYIDDVTEYTTDNRPTTRDDQHDGQLTDQEERRKKCKRVCVYLPILGMVVIVTVFLVLLYFLFDYVVYVAIAFFTVAGGFSLYNCLSFLLKFLPINTELTICKKDILLKDVVLLVSCWAFSITWAVMRHSRYAWCLQDILGVSICITAITLSPLKSFKSCTILMIAFFIYDVFFVFITPLFTPNGQSIMVQAISGESNSKMEWNRLYFDGIKRELIPFIFLVPKVHFCIYSFGILGFGDVIIPGWIVAYCYKFDRFAHTRWKIYWVFSVIGYAIGLILCGIALFFMRSAQPALLYIIPMLFLTSLPVAYFKKQLKSFWTGTIVTVGQTGSNISENSDQELDGNHERNPLVSPATDDASSQV